MQYKNNTIILMSHGGRDNVFVRFITSGVISAFIHKTIKTLALRVF